MLTIVLSFAAITALFEAFMLLKFVSLKKLMSPWMAAFVHIIVFGINIVVHWGTIVGTMTAVTAALVSFAVYPCVIWLKAAHTSWKEQENEKGTVLDH